MKTAYYLASTPNNALPILNKAYRAGATVSWKRAQYDITFARLVSASEAFNSTEEDNWFWVNRDRTLVRSFSAFDTWTIVNTRAGSVVKLVNTRW
jgi:hypothetical protein